MLIREGNHIIGASNRFLCPRSQWRVHSFGQRTGRDLIAECLNCLRWWPNPGEALLDHAPGKLSILTQEAVARVDRVRA